MSADSPRVPNYFDALATVRFDLAPAEQGRLVGRILTDVGDDPDFWRTFVNEVSLSAQGRLLAIIGGAHGWTPPTKGGSRG